MNVLPKSIMLTGLLSAVCLVFLFTTYTNVFAWHKDLGIDDTKAAELYKTNPNDPQIKQWQDAMMNEINRYSRTCLEGTGFIQFQFLVDECISKIKTIILANCDAHPNSLLACEDPRFEKYVQTQGKGEGFPQVGDSKPLNLPK